MSLDGAGRLSGFLPGARIVAYVLRRRHACGGSPATGGSSLRTRVTRAGAFAFSPSSPGLSGLAAHLAGDLHTSVPVSLPAIGEAG
jgi:hypothetical protein